eukprot:Colp12_sorted_trinity150504_noHs@13837
MASISRLVKRLGMTVGAGVFTAGFYLQTKPSWVVAAKSSTQAAAPALSKDEFRPFKVKEIEVISHNTRLYRFDLPKDTPLGMHVASCLLTKAEIDGKAVIRPYTPTTGPHVAGHFDLVIKSYPNGTMSKHFWDLKVGDTVDMKGPITKIEYKPNMKKRIGMIAGGTGITPMYQVVNEILENPADKTQVDLIFANVTEDDILLKKQLDELAKKHKNFKVHYVLEKPPKEWTGSVGYVTDAIINKHIGMPSNDTMVFVCGPPGMMQAISGEKAKDYTQGELAGALKRLNFTKDQVFKF